MTLELFLAFFIGVAVGFMVCFIYIRALLQKILSSATGVKKKDQADWWKPDDYDEEGEIYR
jgi:hypothetical protein